MGMDRLACMDVLMAGDDVTKKKPDPLITIRRGSGSACPQTSAL